ncbi:MAG TPA: hypothetical protein VFO55_06895 [Gemmatimonadaceae bacterium]|nr:hypothetical protein [Gemmatimonadaceae bacterium]
MHVSRSISIGLAVALLAGCAGNPKPKTFGTAPTLTPTVEVLGNDRLPLHLRIEMPEAAHVAAFYVVPGEGTQLLFPADSAGSRRLPAGIQEVSTRFAARALNDSSRLLRRPGRVPPPVDAQGIPRGGEPGDRRANGIQEAGYVLVYVSQDSLDYTTLNERVIGVTIPGYSDEAFSTVTKLVRGASSGQSPWTAVAVPFHR